ncbi:MAG: serine protease [Candidatus Edwardsbacteria bacterium RIFOXYD12_FULL_50_11]|uniref:Serine protease n=1 Tax=Candidatus Edwardsbacteria bacterium GWF2_54_11 TaxID=1817851 RepID=A0A1F5RC29_9BACT|nr:MAG: serine protease [Candidatus Edwardsbacteria bacterium RifOxyC12_full_54_24]OGF07449.1 MAG: serine protease [Candidatus Edwardsbacteria bacterium RifOxyA12_full_54_48]OGF09699.1 MAG: serine protease [Candidatus Edwardsbacteria bacterium GWE2_54_12]OGF11962.1 MAG: serine protease [Candidatus Edwardsbacteria bacterium GWF2_54_11]OGF18144.1 MAG: serine protease [Candidatus Edwardsbacteria bacterium RIFOXYD12_FULL_50_11]OGJ19612.1 MAG: serine protease [Candidatus Edwardsbacteria bacterium R
MKKVLLFTSIILSGLVSLSTASQVMIIRVEDAISPASARFMVQSIEKARDQKAECLIIEMDTPGGLDQSMRQVIKAIMASKVPVVVFVAPQGSRAASAGAFITMASHVAAMSPGSSIGAAHPVSVGTGQMDSTMSGKVTNDAAAYIRSIAEKRGRNIAWADSAVRSSVSLSETEALKRKVIDLIADDTEALLVFLEGRQVVMGQDTVVLHTKGAEKVQVEMNWRDRILSIISNPNIAYILFMAGLLGLYFEFSNPGAIFPGVVGAISLILAFFSFQTLPVNYAGMLLIILAIVLFILDVKIASHGILSIGGIVAMFLGSVMLFQTPDPAMRVSLQVIIPVVLVTAAFFIIGVWLSIKTLRTRPVSGDKGLLGREGDARTVVNKDGGSVFVEGTHWNAWSDAEIPEGAKVRVVEVKGMRLKVIKSE